MIKVRHSFVLCRKLSNGVLTWLRNQSYGGELSMAAVPQVLIVSNANAVHFHLHSHLDGERGDSIIVGASNTNHLKENLGFFSGSRGPLPGFLVKAFVDAWVLTRVVCASYFR